MSLSSLQNGSDIRGVAMDGIAGQEITLTQEACYFIGLGFAKWLAEYNNCASKNLRVSIGRDSRLTGEAIYQSVAAALNSQNVGVSNFGLASTPAMFMSTVTKDFEFDGAIMITASHLPFNRNGLKFFTNNGGLDKANISLILTYAQEFQDSNNKNLDSSINQNINKNNQNIDFMTVYSDILVNKIRSSVNSKNYNTPLDGFKIIVDAGNGGGGFYVEKVLQKLGADTSGSQFLEPDGNFPSHAPNPEDSVAMASIQKAVLENKADFGIIFDTDVDRAGAVDRFGNEINKNKLIALISAISLQEHPKTTIVTDSITSDGLSKFITNLGGVHHRFQRGYKNVINEAIRLNSIGQDCQVAIETSGHGALKENYFLDDGAYLITKILIKIAQLKLQNQEITELIASLEEPVEKIECRLNIKDTDFLNYGKNILEELKLYAKKNNWTLVTPNFEGVRISFNQDSSNNNISGWCLLRLSLHDPLMPLNIESNSIGGCKNIALILLDFLNNFDKLDLSSITNYINKN